MPSDEAAFASNWRTVILVDAALGLAVVVAGVAWAVVADAVLGAVTGAAGTAYTVLVARRFARWRRRRAEAGL